MARHTRFKPEIAAEIIRLHSGGKSIRKIVREDRTMPSRMTIYNWRDAHPDFGVALDNAKRCCADEFAEAIVDIADTEDDAKKAKNRIDSRIWLASKIHRKQYGDKFEIEVNQKINIGPVLANAMARLKHVSLEHPPQIEEAQIS